MCASGDERSFLTLPVLLLTHADGVLTDCILCMSECTGAIGAIKASPKILQSCTFWSSVRKLSSFVFYPPPHMSLDS
jgi:hypothetical protein